MVTYFYRYGPQMESIIKEATRALSENETKILDIGVPMP
jgi:hypothetical protein